MKGGGISVNVITTFPQKRRERQIRFERSVLRELSIEALKMSVRHFFGSFESEGGSQLVSAIEEGCYDIAIESFLIGIQYSRLGYYGVPWEEIRMRSEKELSSFSQGLSEFIHYWTRGEEEQRIDEKLLESCKLYVENWFQEGFLKGKMKYKLKLH